RWHDRGGRPEGQLPVLVGCARDCPERAVPDAPEGPGHGCGRGADRVDTVDHTQGEDSNSSRRSQHMFITKASLSRRTVLRGLGATFALPLLDAMVPALTPVRL